ncbi:hypothetical protein [Natronorubrum sp. DTA7]|uniref:hypothetical protein n=1 Tax=Natronorubrum sp. DTA7 TaxID=3447016 RepID=UPI003F83D574
MGDSSKTGAVLIVLAMLVTPAYIAVIAADIDPLLHGRLLGPLIAVLLVLGAGQILSDE